LNDHECKITQFHRVVEDMLQGGSGLGCVPDSSGR
jgi:hypothetical protein